MELFAHTLGSLIYELVVALLATDTIVKSELAVRKQMIPPIGGFTIQRSMGSKNSSSYSPNLVFFKDFNFSLCSAARRSKNTIGIANYIVIIFVILLLAFRGFKKLIY